MSTSLADLDVEQVVALLASWRLDKQMASTIREHDIDGFTLNEVDQDDFTATDFPAMNKVCALSSKQKSMHTNHNHSFVVVEMENILEKIKHR